jgi:hypothetical protein
MTAIARPIRMRAAILIMARIRATRILARKTMMRRMPRVWRTIALVAVAAGLIAAGAVPAQAARAAYGVSIRTTDKLGSYYGYTLVFYKTRGGYETATISGTVTGAVSGDVAALLAEPFGAKSFTPTGKQVTLATTGTAPYSFSDTPALATKYEVQVSTSGQVDATSSAAIVYVSAGGYSGHARTHCSRGHCTTSWKSYTLLPASAYRTESAKRWYLYFAVGRSAPEYVYRYKDASASKAHKINAGEFETTFTFRYRSRLKNPAPDLYATGCVKDTAKIDGMGLPRPTGCGNKKILWDVYVG